MLNTVPFCVRLTVDDVVNVEGIQQLPEVGLVHAGGWWVCPIVDAGQRALDLVGRLLVWMCSEFGDNALRGQHKVEWKQVVNGHALTSFQGDLGEELK
jgi:hypothetical protein